MSSFDRDALLKITERDHIYVIPNGVDINYFKPSFNQKCSGADLLFIGAMDYLPNADAMLYFCREIFPIIKSHISDVKLHIIGKNPPAEILQLEEIDGVEVGGHDESKEISAAGGYIDVRPYYDKCSVFIVPLRIGSGTRYKILDTLSKGKPIVSTSIGCQGIEVTDGMNIIIRDKPYDFAKATVNLLNNKNLQEKLIKNGRKLITEKYD